VSFSVCAGAFMFWLKVCVCICASCLRKFVWTRVSAGESFLGVSAPAFLRSRVCLRALSASIRATQPALRNKTSSR